MAEIVITLLFAFSMWTTIWLLTDVRRRHAPPPTMPGQLTPAQRRRLYKRLGLNPALLARQRRYDVASLQRPIARRRSTDA